MRSVIVVLLCCGVCLGLAACGSGGSADASRVDVESPIAVTSAVKPSDADSEALTSAEFQELIEEAPRITDPAVIELLTDGAD